MRGRWTLLLATCLALVATDALYAQSAGSQGEVAETPSDDVPKQVEVQSVTDDSEIAARLTRILQATEWFDQPEVRVQEGVVFLGGQAKNAEHKQWAGRLAANTQDVVAVVNRIEVTAEPVWDLTPAWNELRELGAQVVQNSPLIGLGILLLVATWFAAQWSVKTARAVFRRRLKNQLLRDIAARAVAVPVFLLGLYLVLKVSGLTRLAMTVLGGTGLVGLVIGFAFRDIAENFLASILISMQHPFARGDLIAVAGCQGYVQSVNTRSTLLMTLEGNHVQIPNATIYKENIINFTANPNARFDFTVGIGYDGSIVRAQRIAQSVLRDHPAVIADPEPLVLVDGLGAATVNLRVYFWVNVHTHSFLKVRSAVIRLTKAAFDDAGISMPDEAREVVFPAGVPVRTITDDQRQRESHREPSDQLKRATSERESAEPSGEGDLSSEAEEINQQAQMARSPEIGTDLLD